MRHSLSRAAAFALLIGAAAQLGRTQEKGPEKAPFERVPQLVLTHAGPHAPVTAVAFAPDAATLYVAGFDKQIRRYKLAEGRYVADGTIRVPIGPGNAGVVNALAVSPDGKWVAAAGRAPLRSEGWASPDDGIDLETKRFRPEVQADAGVIYLFDPTNPAGGKVLRGPRLGVRSLAFANPSPATGPVVVATSIEYDDREQRVGVVRVFDVNTGKETASRADLPPVELFPPGVAAWATGVLKTGLRVVVGWDKSDGKGPQPSKLLTWDDPAPNGGGKSAWSDAERIITSPLSMRVADGQAVELVHSGFDTKLGTGLNITSAAGETRSEKLTDAKGRPTTPHGIATAGDATALLIPDGTDAARLLQYEMRLVTPKGSQSVTLSGCPRVPVLSASPDGRFLAVAGFADNRVEVYGVAALAGGKAEVQTLAGGGQGFDRVAFLVGEKVWVGRGNEAPNTGGAVLDLGVEKRVAAPPDKKAAEQIDAPANAPAPRLVEPDAANRTWRVAVAVGGADKVVALPDGARPTAAAFLPAKPAWDADRGPLLAVAVFYDRAQSARVALYDPTDGKELFQFGGPALPVRALAFSGTRALLAAAGDDGTVPVWSLKSLVKYPAIDGLAIADVNGAVTVTKVRDKTAAAEVFKEGDVIVSVANAKAVQIPVKVPLDFPNTVRGLKIGDKADVVLKDRAVKVAVGERTGFRQPLFTLWVDPVANAGRHEWVGWAVTGRYDASGKGGEDRIGWVAATGDPARPVSFAGANQYRKLFYTRDFIRLLLKHADHAAALAEIPPLPPPLLLPVLPGVEVAGRNVVRDRPGSVVLQLERLETTLDLDRAQLQWRISGPNAAAGQWTTDPFTGGRRTLNLQNHDWARGEHRVEARLLQTDFDGKNPAPVGQPVVAKLLYVPRPPALKVFVDGKEYADGATHETEAAEVAVTATATAKDDPLGAAVTLDAGVAIKLERGATAKVPLTTDETAVRVTAINAGPGATADEETAVVVRVRKLKPKVVPPPQIALTVETPHEHRTSADAAYIFGIPKARVTARVGGPNAVTDFRWKDGDAGWKVGTLDAKTQAATRDIALPADGSPLVVQVQAKSANSEFATAQVTLRYEGLPDVRLVPPPARVAEPDLLLSGGLKVAGTRPFAVRVVVTGTRTGQTREFDASFDAGRTAWRSPVALFPGENRIGYAIDFGPQRGYQSEPVAAVSYLRPPVLLGGNVIDLTAGGDVLVAAVAPADAAARELTVGGAPAGFRTGPPARVFGLPLWAVAAPGAAANAGEANPPPRPVVLRTDEGESRPLMLAVRAAPPPPAKVEPPVVRLTRNGKGFAPDQGLQPVSDPRFGFDVVVNSEVALTRFEVSFGTGPTAELVPVGDVGPAAARAVPGGFELTTAPAVALRRGANNYVRVVAANAAGTTAVGFGVSYTPAPPRVVIDRVGEPDGEAKPLPRDGPLQVGTPAVEVEGRVLWDDDREPIARDRELAVVFVANGVSHVPVPVERYDASTGKRERAFRGRVYLNTLDPNPNARGLTRVRVELRSGETPREQETDDRGSPEPLTFAVQSRKPLTNQRLHVVVFGVRVPKEDEADLLRRVVKAVGGDAGDGPPGDTFARPDFTEAILYRKLGYTRQSDLNAMLTRVRQDIESHASRNGWQNDVVVVYYHGYDWVDGSGRWLLDSAVTMGFEPAEKRSGDAIRLDDLAQTHGMPVAVVNVASAAAPATDLAIDLPYLRVAWAQAAQRGRLLDQFADALSKQRRTFGAAAGYVGANVGPGARLAESLPAEGVGGRVVGLGP
jgi:WD40 repeat protein